MYLIPILNSLVTEKQRILDIFINTGLLLTPYKKSKEYSYMNKTKNLPSTIKKHQHQSQPHSQIWQNAWDKSKSSHSSLHSENTSIKGRDAVKKEFNFGSRTALKNGLENDINSVDRNDAADTSLIV